MVEHFPRDYLHCERLHILGVVAAYSPVFHADSKDYLADLGVNLTALLLPVVAKTVELARFVAQKTADSWRTLDVAAANSQVAVQCSMDYVECHSE